MIGYIQCGVKNTSGNAKNNIEIAGKIRCVVTAVFLLNNTSSLVAQPIIYQHALEKRLCCVSILRETKGEGAKK